MGFFRKREGGKEGERGDGRTEEGGGRRPRPGAAAAAATAKNPRPKKLLKSRGGARRNASSDTRAQAAQGAPAGRSKQGLRRLQEGTQPRAPQGRSGDEIEQDRARPTSVKGRSQERGQGVEREDEGAKE